MQSEKTKFILSVRRKEVDPTCSHPLYLKFLESSALSSAQPHYLRNCQTLAGIINSCDVLEDRKARIVETGGASIIGQFLAAEGFSYRTTSSDLRYSIDVGDGQADLLLSLEVIEHLKDQTSANMCDIVLFRETGVRQYCAEMARVVRSGGRVVLTSPNPCSLVALTRLLQFEPPVIFRPHVREYSRQELCDFMTGFAVEHYSTNFSFFHLGQAGAAEADRVFKLLGADEKCRGDDHLFVFKKSGGLAA